MKVLLYIPSIGASSGGVGSFIHILSGELGKLCELHVLTHPEDDEYKLENCTVHYIPYKWKPWDNCKREFLSLLDELRPDVFHTNCCWMPVSALTVIWAKRHTNGRIKVVYSPHGMLEPYSFSRHYWTRKLPAVLAFQRRGVALADIVHATSELEKKNLLKLGWNKNIEIVPNAVRVAEIPFKLETSHFERNRNILFLSRVHPKKGIEYLIDAVSSLKDCLDGYCVTVAGPGDPGYVGTLVERCRNLGVDSMFNFVGSVFGEAKWSLYHKADIFVLPTHSENFGIVVAESLACGTPVITTTGTPWKELNEYGCGWCVEAGANGLIDALRAFLSCADSDLDAMGRRGHMLVAEKYDVSVVADSFIRMYSQLF